MISTRNLSRTFQRGRTTVEAVKGIDLNVKRGELVAFLGPNGAGKSTTLRMLTGLLAPTTGSASVAGHDVVAAPQRVRETIGYIGQGNSAGHYFRVGDELASQAHFYGIPAAEGRRRSAELLSALELEGLEKRTVNTLSGGQRRRLDVAMGLLNHPPLLFLDEPSTGMDPASRANLWEHVQRMRERYGMTMVLTTHYLEEADRMAERVIIIDNGSIIADASPDELRRRHASDTVRLSFGTDQGARSAAQALGGVATKTPPSIDGDELTLELDDGPAALPEVLHLLDGAGLRPQRARVAEASLDDVFLNLTGRSLREESDTDADPAPAMAGSGAMGGAQ